MTQPMAPPPPPRPYNAAAVQAIEAEEAAARERALSEIVVEKLHKRGSLKRSTFKSGKSMKGGAALMSALSINTRTGKLNVAAANEAAGGEKAPEDGDDDDDNERSNAHEASRERHYYNKLR